MLIESAGDVVALRILRYKKINGCFRKLLKVDES